jgi:hypothetical protein
METMRSFETFVYFYRITWSQISEDSNLRQKMFQVKVSVLDKLKFFVVNQFLRRVWETSYGSIWILYIVADITVWYTQELNSSSNI